jgi:UDP-N-acetylbacillosamine N-acetyltransferase
MRVAVYGSGGHGKVVADIVDVERRNEVVAFFDDSETRNTKTIGDLRVISVRGKIREAAKDAGVSGIVLGIGDNRARASVAERCRAAGLPILSAIHPHAAVARSANLGDGVVIMAGAVVNPSVQLEEGVCINTSASVDHDCIIRRYAHVWPGAHIAGTVEVGEFSYIGMGASVLQNLRIGKGVTIGAGAVVLEDIEDGVTAVGVPARPIKRLKSAESE